jgi:hypothetical protein
MNTCDSHTVTVWRVQGLDVCQWQLPQLLLSNAVQEALLLLLLSIAWDLRIQDSRMPELVVGRVQDSRMRLESSTILLNVATMCQQTHICRSQDRSTLTCWTSLLAVKDGLELPAKCSSSSSSSNFTPPCYFLI